jgi:hypothetical protein
MPQAQVLITDLPQALALTGTEAVPIVQNGVTVQTTTGSISGAGALNYPFLTVGSVSGLTLSRYLATGSGLSLTDNGAGGTLQINLTGAAQSLESSGTGIQVKTGSNTVTGRSLAVGSGLGISNPDGVSGSPTISLGSFLSNFVSLTGTGMLAIQSGTVGKISILGTTNQISILNGDGSGSVTVGLVSNPVLPGTASVTIPVGTTAQRPGSPTVGEVRYNTDLSVYEAYSGGVWNPISFTTGVTQVNTGLGLLGGPITSTGTISVDPTVVATTTNTLTMTNKSMSGSSNAFTNIPNSALVNSSVTFNGTTVALGSSGSITAINPNALTIGTGLSGGSYDGSLAVTVAIANTGVSAASYGSASSVPTIAINSQGQITSASNTSIAINGNQITSGTIGSSYITGSYTGITGVGTLTAGTWNASTITVPYGGTGATTLTGLVKGNGTSAFTAAVAGTDYAPPTSGSSILYGNGSGGFSNVTIGTGVSFSGGTLSATGSGGTVTSVSGTGTVSGITLSGTVTSSGSLTLGGSLDLSSPPEIGSTTANTGAFTTLSASSTVSGVGFSNYLASPPAIGGTTPAAGTFTTLIGGGGSANYGQLTGGATTKAVQFQTLGTDSNISMVFQPKGTGSIDLAPGSSGVNISNGGTVTAITRTAGGSNYTSVPSVAITAPTTAGGVQATATATVTLSTGGATIVSGGTGYSVNDVLTVSGGTGTAVQLTVATVSSGVITSVTITNFGSYSIAPTNPVSVTGGTGSGATFNLSYGVNTVFTITNAGSGYVEQPTVSFSSGGGSGAAAYATVGGNVAIKGIGNQINFYAANSGIGLQIYDAGGGSGTGGYWKFAQNYSSQAVMYASSVGSISSGGTNQLSFYTNTITSEQFRVAHTASAVNYVQVTGSATGALSSISTQGSDTTTYLGIGVKGTAGYIAFYGQNSTSNQAFRISGNASSTGNLILVQGAASGSAPSISSISGTSGTDTNIDLNLTPKGSGLVSFGTYTTGAPTATGYISIKSAAGVTYKVLVST